MPKSRSAAATVEFILHRAPLADTLDELHRCANHQTPTYQAALNPLQDEPNNGSPSPCARRVQPRSRRLSSRRLRPGHDQGERRRPRAGAGLRGRRPSQARSRAGRELHRPPCHAGSGRRAHLPRPLARRPKREDRATRQGATGAPLLPPQPVRSQRTHQGRPQAQRTVASQKELRCTRLERYPETAPGLR